MVISETARMVDQVRSNGRNGHGVGELTINSIPPAAPLETEAERKVPEFTITTSLQKQIFEQDPGITGKVKELDKVSEKWIRAKLSGGSEDEINRFEAQASTAGEILRETIEGLIFSPATEYAIRGMYDEMCLKAGEKDMTIAVKRKKDEDGIDLRFAGQNVVFLNQKGENGVLDAVKKYLASRFAGTAVGGRNEARFEMLQEFLKDNPEDIDGALQKSEVLSHANSSLAVVVERWQMQSSQK